MPVVRCPACATEIPAGAKFCPRCGAPAPAHDVDDEHDDKGRPTAVPANLAELPAPIPLAGILFLVALVVGPVAVVAGIVTGVNLLLFAGIAVAVGVLIMLLVGLVS